MKKMASKRFLLGMSVIVLVFGLISCASVPKTPKSPKTIVYDSNLAEDQMATLFVPAGFFEVTQFEHRDYGDRDLKLKPTWFQPSIKDTGMDVKIPAGESAITFKYYNLTFGNTAGSPVIVYNYVAGRRYKLVAEVNGSNYIFSVLETSSKRNPGPDEQLFYIKQKSYYGGILVVLDKNTANERTMLLDPVGLENKELCVVIPKGEHTIDLALMKSAGKSSTIEQDGEQPGVFTASETPVRYIMTLKTKTGLTSSGSTYTLEKE